MSDEAEKVREPFRNESGVSKEGGRWYEDASRAQLGVGIFMTFAAKTKCFSFVSLLCIVASLSCSKWKRENSDNGRLAALQLNEAPNIPTKLDTPFGEQVTLLGYSLSSKGPIRPKEKIKVTFYWRLNKKLDNGFRLSTRVIGERAETLLNADDVGGLRERRGRQPLLPLANWVEGKIYVDEQVLRMPEQLPGKLVKLQVAIRKAEDSLAPKRGEVDKRGYLTIAQFPVQVRPRATKVPQLTVPMLDANAKIKLDGKLDEEAWKTAASLPTLVNLSTGRVVKDKGLLSATVKLLWNEQALFMAFDVHERDLDGGFKKTAKEPPVWKRDALEFIFKTDAQANNKDYYRVAVGLQNLVFDSVYDDFETPNLPDRGPVGDLRWSSNVKTGLTLSGTLDDASDEDQGYIEELEFPWASFARNNGFVAKDGASLWLNFAVGSRGAAPIGFVPYFDDKSLQVARHFGKIVLAPAGTPPTEPSQVPPLTTQLPAALVEAQAAATAAVTKMAGVTAAVTSDSAKPAANASASPVVNEAEKPENNGE